MSIYLYKVDLFDKERGKDFVANKKVAVKADSPKEAGEKLKEHFKGYAINHHAKGVLDEYID